MDEGLLCEQIILVPKDPSPLWNVKLKLLYESGFLVGVLQEEDASGEDILPFESPLKTKKLLLHWVSVSLWGNCQNGRPNIQKIWSFWVGSFLKETAFIKIESLVLVLQPSLVQITSSSLISSLETKFDWKLEEKSQMMRFSSIHSPDSEWTICLLWVLSANRARDSSTGSGLHDGPLFHFFHVDNVSFIVTWKKKRMKFTAQSKLTEITIVSSEKRKPNGYQAKHLNNSTDRSHNKREPSCMKLEVRSAYELLRGSQNQQHARKRAHNTRLLSLRSRAC